MDNASKLYKFIADRPEFFKGGHDVHTPKGLVEEILSKIELENKTFLVLFNVEFVISLVYTYGVSPENITFYSDHDNKTLMAERFGVKYCTSLDGLMQFDFVVLNPPFGKFNEFKSLSESLAKEKVLIISGSRDYHNGSAFENVEYYKYLGSCFPTAKITASLAIINPKGVTQLTIVDKDGIHYNVQPNPKVAPGDDMGIWMFASKVLDKNLPGYTNAEKGQIDRKGSKLNPSGIPVIYSAGKNGEDFTEENRATTVSSLVKDNTKFCWATVDPSQTDLIGGLGKHKVVVTHAANEPGHLGNPKYAAPNWGCGTNCWYIECTDKNDAENCIKYLTHPAVVKLVKGLKSSVTSNSKAVWKKIPHHSVAKDWIENYA